MKAKTKFLFTTLLLEKQVHLIVSILQSLQNLGRNLKRSSESKDKEHFDLNVERTVSDHTDNGGVQHKDTGLGIKDFEVVKEPAEKAKD